MKFQSLSQIIRERRSIYPAAYNDKPISKETILTLLENANWAPNHKKTEPWRWKVFRGDALQSLSEYLGKWYEDNTPSEKYSEIKHKKTIKKPIQCQAVIAICMYDDPEVTIPEWEQLAAVSCAVQNLWLSCSALGIGAYWSSPRSALEASDFLNLGPHEKCYGLFYMGYSDLPSPEGKRQPVNDTVTWM